MTDYGEIRAFDVGLVVKETLLSPGSGVSNQREEKMNVDHAVELGEQVVLKAVPDLERLR